MKERGSVRGNDDGNDLLDSPLQVYHTLQFLMWVINVLARNRWWCIWWGNLGKSKNRIFT